MIELKACPCCGKNNYVGKFTIDLSLNIVMFGCSRCAFFAENKTAWNTRADGWVSVECRLPDRYGAYLCTGPDIDHEIVWFDPDSGWRDEYSTTHWMPLPEPPEDSK